MTQNYDRKKPIDISIGDTIILKDGSQHKAIEDNDPNFSCYDCSISDGSCLGVSCTGKVRFHFEKVCCTT